MEAHGQREAQAYNGVWMLCTQRGHRQSLWSGD